MEKLQKWQVTEVILDPIMVSGTGYNLLNSQVINLMIRKLLPLVKLVTPNIREATTLIKIQAKKEQAPGIQGEGAGGTQPPEKEDNLNITSVTDMKKAAAKIYKLGATGVLLKGGHLSGTKAVDVFYNGQSSQLFSAPRIETANIHGTGCTYSAAIAAFLARGFSLSQAIKRAKKYLTAALAASFVTGQGDGVLHHFYRFY